MAVTPEHRIAVHLDELLEANEMTLVELSSRVGVTVANLSILKNSHAKAVRFSTLTAICDALGCTPGDLLTLHSRPRSPNRRKMRRRGGARAVEAVLVQVPTRAADPAARVLATQLVVRQSTGACS